MNKTKTNLNWVLILLAIVLVVCVLGVVFFSVGSDW